MRHCVILALIFVLSVLATAQNAPEATERCRTNLKVDEFLLPSDAQAAKRAFAEFRRALLSDNRQQVMALMNFPANFVIDGYPVSFETSQKFASEYAKVFTRYVIHSVQKQKPDGLLGGWEGVKLSNGSVIFIQNANGEFRISDIRPKYVRPSKEIVEFLEHRPTCPPTVIEGRVLAYNWVTHKLPGFENIYIDHLIVEVAQVLSGSVPSGSIRVDFWGVTHLPEYNLPVRAFEPGAVWRMYLRPAAEPPANNEVCRQDVQESISFTDEAGRELERKSAITVLSGKESLTYQNLPCFEVNKQFFSLQSSAGGNP